MSLKLVYSGIMFISIFFLLSLGFGLSSINAGNPQLTNATIINAGNGTLTTLAQGGSICTYTGPDIPILSNIIGGANCIANGINIILTLVSLGSTGNPFVDIIFLALGISFLILVIMILRGNGII